MKRLSLLTLFALTGCSHYSSDFDCPRGEGVECASISKVNQMIDQKLIDTEEEITVKAPKDKRLVHIYYGPKKMDKVITIKDQTDF